MGSSGVAPGCGSDLKIRLMTVHDTGHGKLRHGLWLLYELDIGADEPEMSTHVNHGNLDAVSGNAVKHEAGRILLSAYPERMNLNLGLCCRKGRRNLKHMGSKLQLLSLRKVIGVILNEARSSLLTLCHLHKHRAERAYLVITLGAEADPFPHKVLNRKARKLLKPVKILEGIDKGACIPILQEFPEAHLILRLFPYSLDIIGSNGISALIILHLGIDLGLRRCVDAVNKVTDSVIVGLPAETDLALNPVAVGYRNISHIVAEERKLKVP